MVYASIVSCAIVALAALYVVLRCVKSLAQATHEMRKALDINSIVTHDVCKAMRESMDRLLAVTDKPALGMIQDQEKSEKPKDRRRKNIHI